MFSFELYKWRGMIEAIFGAEKRIQRSQPAYKVQEKGEQGKMVGDYSNRLEPEGSEQVEMYKGAGHGGEINHKKLGDNLGLEFKARHVAHALDPIVKRSHVAE